MSDYPYDEEVLEELARLLYGATPAMYRVPDAPPAGRGELQRMLEVLAGPLAVLRQSIRELHADLFIDTAHDRMIPYLAEMVGTRLVFPDAASNRRDVRATVSWRRRKGTPPALEEMGSELTGRSVVLQEGWKRILLAQDLDLVRPERVVPDLRPGVVAEQASGPLDALMHAVDVRPISATSGRYHPRHVSHWLHPTITFPLREATAADRSVPGSEPRFAFDPLGARHHLRARRSDDARGPFTDRVPELHFAAAPERWFGRRGGFTVRICGLQAAIAGEPAAERAAHALVASRLLARAPARITALRLPSRGWHGGIHVELGLATVTGTDTWQPNPATFSARASLDLDAGGASNSTSAGPGGAGGARVPLLRLTPLGGLHGRHFPGAVLELAGGALGAVTAAQDSGLAREGFLRGVLHVEIPPLDIRETRLLHIAADGSLYEATTESGALIPMPVEGGHRALDRAALLATGPGPAWPPQLAEAEPRMFNRVPSAPGRGPAVLHGAKPLRRVAAGLADILEGTKCALAFAAQREAPGGPEQRPFLRLEWTGADPTTATWTEQDLAAVAAQREAEPDAIALAVRFECSEAGATLCPGEVAFSGDDGTTILVHLPQLDAEPPAAGAQWPLESPYAVASAAVRVAEDGSTWAAGSTAGRRASLGAIAPIAEAAGLRRRRVRWRRLCAWDREDWLGSPVQTLAPPPPGRLDVDVAHGLFAMAPEEPPQRWSARTGSTGVPPSVTIDLEEGATMHIGARPSAREPELDARLERPTRLVARSGALHPDAPADWHEIPRYDSLEAALEAISVRWQALALANIDALADAEGVVAEVVQFEDSATYPDEAPAWPQAPSDAAVRDRARLSLTIQAAERERPVVLVDPGPGWALPAAAARLEALTLRGVAFGGAGWTGMKLPPARRTALELCTVLDAGAELNFGELGAGAHVSVTRCETAGLVLAGHGLLTVKDSIVDARPGVALGAPAGEVVLDRVSVGGEVQVRVLEASEVIFEDRVAVENRFRGCVRYSRVPRERILPRVHRLAIDTPVRLVSHNRRDPAWWRLAADCDAAVSRGAESGTEMGAFSSAHLAERLAGFERRLEEFTPAGLVTGILRVD